MMQTAKEMYERPTEKSKELAGTAKLETASHPQETLEKARSSLTKDSKSQLHP